MIRIGFGAHITILISSIDNYIGFFIRCLRLGGAQEFSPWLRALEAGRRFLEVRLRIQAPRL